LIGLGFGLALIAGLFLASRAAEAETGALVGTALVAFIPVALLIGAGIVLYMRQSPAEEPVVSTVHLQRELLDVLRERRSMTVDALAETLDTEPEQVNEMVHQLAALQIFSGYLDRRNETLSIVEPDDLRQQHTCLVCETPIDLNGQGTVICRVCGTEYFLATLQS
jgi:hypothetical protein